MGPYVKVKDVEKMISDYCDEAKGSQVDIVVCCELVGLLYSLKMRSRTQVDSDTES
jgi:hypothetical protein